MTSNVSPTLLGSVMNSHTKKIKKYVSTEIIGTYFQYNEMRVMRHFCHLRYQRINSISQFTL